MILTTKLENKKIHAIRPFPFQPLGSGSPFTECKNQFPYFHNIPNAKACSGSGMSANHLSFSTIPMSLVRTFSMMLGEMDFIGTYVQPFYYGELALPVPSFLLFCKILNM